MSEGYEQALWASNIPKQNWKVQRLEAGVSEEHQDTCLDGVQDNSQVSGVVSRDWGSRSHRGLSRTFQDLQYIP